MNEPSLQQLERDVEVARAQLVGGLKRLRSPETYNQFKSRVSEEAVGLKDAMVEKAKSKVQSTFDSVLEDVKARAAANPAAALAIGAGIAWRLLRHPPIATALVGLGMISLFRTSPAQTNHLTDQEYLSQGRRRLVEQAGDLAETVKERAVELGHAAAEKSSEFAANIKDRAVELGEAATERAAELTDAAKEQTREWTSEATSATRRMTGAAASALDDTSTRIGEMQLSASYEAARLRSRAGAAVEEYARPVQQTLGHTESRDNLLLGAASIAVVTALGIACQRRLNEPAGGHQRSDRVYDGHSA
jgi:hypothetical protein